MKFLFALLLSLSSLSALALDEVECAGVNTDSNQIGFSIEQGWSSSIRDARLLVYSSTETDPEETIYRISSVRGRIRRMYHTGPDDIRLELDLFPDRTPRWGRYYNSSLSASYGRIGTLNCRFPQVRP